MSIVTPSYNQGQFIEETIRSVLLQGYPDLEYAIVDGGSTDDSVAIIRKYESWLSYWVSEPDSGQSDAINKGLGMAHGEIVAYLNSDDTYMPRAVQTAVDFLAANPSVAMVYGHCNIIDENSQPTGIIESTGDFGLREIMCGPCMVPQPATFLRRSALESVGYFDISLHMGMDLDMWIRIGLKFDVRFIPEVLASFRRHTGAKTLSQNNRFMTDHLAILRKTYAAHDLPVEVRRFRREAFSFPHLGLFLRYGAASRPHLALFHLSRAIMLHPPRFRQLGGTLVLAALVLRCTLGTRATTAIRGMLLSLGLMRMRRGD